MVSAQPFLLAEARRAGVPEGSGPSEAFGYGADVRSGGIRNQRRITLERTRLLGPLAAGTLGSAADSRGVA